MNNSSKFLIFILLCATTKVTNIPINGWHIPKNTLPNPIYVHELMSPMKTLKFYLNLAVFLQKRDLFIRHLQSIVIVFIYIIFCHLSPHHHISSQSNYKCSHNAASIHINASEYQLILFYHFLFN